LIHQITLAGPILVTTVVVAELTVA